MTGLRKIVAAGLLAALAVAVLGAAGLVAGVALAQTPTPPAQGSDLDQTFWQALATRLGTTVEAVQQAFQGAAKDTVAQGVQDGTLTQEQADRYNEYFDNWQPGDTMRAPFPFHGGPGGFHHGRGGHVFGMLGGAAVLDAAAGALGMERDALVTELQSGKSLADVAAEQNVDVDTVKQAMVDAAKAEVDQALADGRITQDQADEIKARIDELAANLDLSQPFLGGLCPGKSFGFGVPEVPAEPATPANEG